MPSDKVKNLRTGVFIDGSNLFWAMKELENCGKEKWLLDYDKLKEYLKRQYSPVFYKYFGCTDDHPSTDNFRKRAEETKKFYAKLEGLGYGVETKPLKYIRGRDGKIHTKGDMDLEIAMSIKNSLGDIDNIILISGDSDFLTAVKDFHANGKYIRIYSYEHTLSWELKLFAINNVRCNYILLDKLRSNLEMKESRRRT